MHSILRGKRDAMKKEVACFAAELVKISSPSMHEGELADLVFRKMRELDYDRVFRDAFGNVVGMMAGRESEPNVLLNCHMDTVDASGEGWDRPPLSGESDGVRIFGRGASDCKGGLAAQIYAGALLKRSLLPLRGTLIVTASVGEENGRSLGIRKLFEETFPSLGLGIDYAVLGEPTDLGLYYGHDGWMTMEIKISGINPFLVEDGARELHDSFSKISGRMNRGGIEEYSVEAPRWQDSGAMKSAGIMVSKRLHARELAEDAIAAAKDHVAVLESGNPSLAVQVDLVSEEQNSYTGVRQIVRHLSNA